MSRPAVSVVIPAHNAQSTLLETLECVLLQDLCDIEVICVDDGSSDMTAHIVEQLAEVDGRLRLVSQAQGGAGRARNAGIDAARGEFVAFLDADDVYEEPSFLRVLYEGAKRAGTRVAAGCFVNWDGAEGVERDFAGTEYDGYQFEGEQVVAWEDFQFDYGFHRFLFERSLFDDGANRFGRLTYFEDAVFLVRILDQARSFFATDKASYLYRCGHARKWTTPAVLDLLEGVAQNLAFSRERGLARLHRYTLEHMEWSVWEIGVGANRMLALDVVDAKLAQVEACIDQELLAQAGAGPLPYVPRLRRAIDSEKRFDPVGHAYRLLRYRVPHV